jgi:hypothetical protein
VNVTDASDYQPPGPAARRDPDEQVAVSPSVADGTAPLLRVRVTEAGWQFLAGPPDPGEPLVALPRREVYRAERGLAVLEEFLPAGYGAVREGPADPWGIGPLSFQDAAPEPSPDAPTGPDPLPLGAAPSGPSRWWRRWRRRTRESG